MLFWWPIEYVPPSYATVQLFKPIIRSPDAEILSGLAGICYLLHQLNNPSVWCGCSIGSAWPCISLFHRDPKSRRLKVDSSVFLRLVVNVGFRLFLLCYPEEIFLILPELQSYVSINGLTWSCLYFMCASSLNLWWSLKMGLLYFIPQHFASCLP